MNKDWDTPVAHKLAFEKNTGGRDDDQNRELSCLRWSKDGRKIAVGDSEGYVSIWTIDKELYLPKQDDFDFIDELIQSNSSEK